MFSVWVMTIDNLKIFFDKIAFILDDEVNKPNIFSENTPERLTFGDRIVGPHCKGNLTLLNP